MRSKWISLRRLKTHEFYRTLRHLRSVGATWHDIYTRLGVMQHEATSRFIKSLSTLLVVFLLLQSLGKGSNVTITILQVTASIPIAYVAMVGAVSLFITLSHLQTAIMLIFIRSAESVRMKLPGFSANMYGLYNGQDEMALVVPTHVNRHFKEIIPVSAFLTFTTMALYLSMLLPIFAYSTFLLSWQVHLVALDGVSWAERVAALVGIFAVVQSFLFLLFFNIPLPLKKDDESIRWGILYRLHPFGSHPKIPDWIGESKKR